MQVLDARRKATARPRSGRRDPYASPIARVSHFAGSAERAVVLYDGRCPMCRRSVRLIAGPLRRRSIAVQPLQRRWVRAMLDIPEAQLLGQMRFVLPEGTIVGGAEAV